MDMNLSHGWRFSTHGTAGVTVPARLCLMVVFSKEYPLLSFPLLKFFILLHSTSASAATSANSLFIFSSPLQLLGSSMTVSYYFPRPLPRHIYSTVLHKASSCLYYCAFKDRFYFCMLLGRTSHVSVKRFPSMLLGQQRRSSLESPHLLWKDKKQRHNFSSL